MHTTPPSRLGQQPSAPSVALWLKAVGRVVIAAHLAVALQPLSALAQGGAPSPSASTLAQIERMGQWEQRLQQAKAEQVLRQLPPAAQASERTSRNLSQMHQLLRGVHSRSQQFVVRAPSPRSAPAPRQTTATPSDLESRLQPQERAQVGHLLDAIDADTQAVLADFEQQRQDLVQRGLAPILLQRHDQAQAQLRQRAQEVSRIAQQWRSQPSQAQATLNALQDFFQRHPAAQPTPTLDPQRLPWRTPQPSQRTPAQTRSAWYQNLYQDQAIHLAQAGGTSIGPLSFNIPPEPGQAPTPADLAETPEITLTPAIRAKAAELGHNPVAIHNWVRNTVHWQPTWGAIQNAQTTLEKSSGNAIDIASLEIALLRAANIPARYEFGTIELSAERAMNWVGGVSRPEAALQLLGQGGIAAQGMASGGRIQSIQMEHAWVSAYVNWAPGRGARNATPSQHPNPNAHLNAWVSLDASYKQYTHSPGMDLQAAVPLDAQGLLNAAQQGASVNAAQGWVQHLNQAAVQSQLNAYQSRLRTHLQTQAPNASVGDVIGRQIIPQVAPSVLSGVAPLPLASNASTTRTASLPSALRHQFQYTLSDPWGNEVLSVQAPVAQLAGQRLTLSYTPASQADADLIASYLPTPNPDGSALRPEQLPSSLPGYLIRVLPRISLNGQVLAQGQTPLTLGEDLQGMGGFTTLADATQWDLSPDASHVAGQASAIGISAAGISPGQLTQLKDRLSQTQATLQAAQANPQNASTLLQTLSGEQLSGDLLTATLWAWFAQAESHQRLSQNAAGVISLPGLSYGLFHAVVQPVKSFGVIRQVKFPGVNMDIGHQRHITWAKDHDEQKWIAYNRLRGQHLSALEHAVPERFFNNPSQCNADGTATPTAGLPNCPRGISSVSALQIAANQGQRIYTLTPAVYNANPNIVQTDLNGHSARTQTRVQEALANGLEVTIHQSPITQDGWSGAGYIIIDPQTGAGAYEIEGGARGSILPLLDNIQKYLITPHVTGFAEGAGLRAFSESFGNFAGVFSFFVDILDFMYVCDGDELTAIVLVWTITTLFFLLVMWLSFAIFSLGFFASLLLQTVINLVNDFLLKPVFISKACSSQ